MKIAIIGAGYVGLSAAVCLSRSGHDVICIEKDLHKLTKLRAGRLPFREEGLQELLEEGITKKTLRFGETVNECLDAQLIMVAVGTPARQDGKIDLSQVYQVITEIVEYAVSPLLLVMKSTVPPGFGINIRERFLSQAKVPISYLYNPEFLREGVAVWDWYHPDRIVIGGDEEEAVAELTRLYSDIYAPVLTMDISSAEMVKYASNAFLATKISFINEIANLCELVGADILPVAHAVGMDERIGSQFLQSGLGYGGSCFPKDTCGLDFVSTCNGYAFNLLKAVIEVNNRQRIVALRKLRKALGTLHDKTIGIWGLAFKPNTDDVRESPALEIINLLLDEGAKIKAYDPLAMENAQKLLPDRVYFTSSAMSAAAESHALLVTTAWPEFISINCAQVRELMLAPHMVLDGRNCLPANELIDNELFYQGIGRPSFLNNEY